MKDNFFTRQLMKWHQADNQRAMPWKGEKDPYKIWLSEIILQQTQVAQGQAYYLRFISHFPDISALARADETLIFKLWEGLGYYRRCRNMIETARYIDRELHGQFPDDYHSILSLKGVGPYTAAAIASFAFGLPYAVVDGNVNRVLSRFFKIEQPTDTGAGKKIIKQLADHHLDKSAPADYNQAIMDLGATICKPINPNCLQCPLRSKCATFKAGKTNQIPVKSLKQPIRKRFFNYFLIRHQSFLWIRKRTEKDIWQELYELPLIESSHLLSQEQMLMNQDLQLFFKNNSFQIQEIIGPLAQQLTHQKIIAQIAVIYSKNLLTDFLGSECISIHELQSLPMPRILHQVLNNPHFEKEAPRPSPG